MPGHQGTASGAGFHLHTWGRHLKTLTGPWSVELSRISGKFWIQATGVKNNCHRIGRSMWGSILHLLWFVPLKLKLAFNLHCEVWRGEKLNPTVVFRGGSLWEEMRIHSRPVIESWGL
jgi:hypothetical protein